MENSKQPISPCLMQQVGDNSFRANRHNDPKEWNRPMIGLTKREHFAAMAMQGWIACQQPGFSGENEDIARRSIECADELLKQLDAGGEKI